MFGGIVDLLRTASPTTTEGIRFRSGLLAQREQADVRIFWLLVAQWGAILLACFAMAAQWENSRLDALSGLIVSVGLVSVVPLAVVLRAPGSRKARWSVAASQGLLSTLLWSVAGGRADTTLHLFAWLIVLSLYRDIPVLFATVIVAMASRGLMVGTGVVSTLAAVDSANSMCLVCLLGETAFVLTFIILDRQALATHIGRESDLLSLENSIETRIEAMTCALVEERNALKSEVASLKEQRATSEAGQFEALRELKSLRRDVSTHGKAILKLASRPADSGLPIEWRSHWQAVRQQAQHLFRLVDLPSMVRDQERPETAPHMQVTKSEQSPAESSHHDLRALLMLRNPVQQAKAVLTLEQAGYTVDVTGNGPRTYYSVMLNDYSIIIVDIDLPGDEGLDTLEALRLLPPDRVAPSNCLFALTAERTADRVLKCTDLGVDGMLLKPLKLDALCRATSIPDRLADPQDQFQHDKSSARLSNSGSGHR